MAELDIRLLCLDFDGVVLESNRIRDAAWGAIFPDLSDVERKRVVAFHRANPGIDRAVKLRHIYSELLGQSPGEEQIAYQLKLFRNICESALVVAPFVPGIVTFLSELDIPVVILSAARVEEVISVCARRGLNRFSAIRGGPTDKCQHLKQLSVEYNLPVSELLMIGDQLTDWHAANQVGCRFVGRIAPDRPAAFGPGILTIKDFSLGWTELKVCLQ